MPEQDNHEPHEPSKFHGLSHEIGEVIRDKEFQTTVNKFVGKSETLLKILKGIGFTVAIASGVFGYLLAANSESDDRKAQMIHKIIDEKKDWAIKVDEGILQVRKTRFLLKYECDHKRAPSSYEQGKKRFLARHDFVRSFTGIREIFGEEVSQTCREFVAFDASVPDVCAKEAPDDEAWRAFLRKINEQMRSSIKLDREKLDELGQGILKDVFKIL